VQSGPDIDGKMSIDEKGNSSSGEEWTDSSPQQPGSCGSILIT